MHNDGSAGHMQPVIGHLTPPRPPTARPSRLAPRTLVVPSLLPRQLHLQTLIFLAKLLQSRTHLLNGLLCVFKLKLELCRLLFKGDDSLPQILTINAKRLD